MKRKEYKCVKLRGLSIIILIPIILISTISNFCENNKDIMNMISDNTPTDIYNSLEEDNNKQENNSSSEKDNKIPENIDSSDHNKVEENNDKSTEHNKTKSKDNIEENITNKDIKESLNPNVPLKSLEIKSYAGEHVSDLTKIQVCTLYGNTPETISNKNNLSDNGNYGGCSFNEDGQLINLSLSQPSKLFYNGNCVNGLTLNEIKELMASDIDWIKRDSYIKLKNNWYLSLQNGRVNYASWCMPGPPGSNKDEFDD